MASEISVQMSMSSEAAFSEASAKIRRAGYEPVRGKGRMAFPIILVVRRLGDAAEKGRLEDLVTSVDTNARPVVPPSVFVN